MLATEARPAVAVEFLKCVADRAYFIDRWCQIKAKAADTEEERAPARWQPFHLWPAQRAVVAALDSGDHLVILKARQLGLTWLLLAAILWQMLFRPACVVLLFSRRETEAYDLLARLRAMFAHLPPWLQGTAGGERTASSSVWILGNGSEARVFPTTAGDSYTAQIAFCDEFDLLDNQDALLEAVGPTVIESGQLLLLSRVDKDKPLSAFKRLYQQANTGALPGWRAIFLPWQARPGRDAAWRAAREAEALAKDGTLDAVQAQYPATDAEALAQRSGNKRLPPAWLLACYHPLPACTDRAIPADIAALAGVTIYALPADGGAYCGGADPAEGLAGGDASVTILVERATGRHVATLAGQLPPDQHAAQTALLATWYHYAPILPERNNHGAAWLLAWRGLGGTALSGSDGREGWQTTAPSKALLYDQAAVCLREGDATISDLATFSELASIDREGLSAPPPLHDDRAVAWVLAQAARVTGAPAAAAVAGAERFPAAAPLRRPY